MAARAYSFEFFPPRTPAGKEKLRAVWRELAALKPKFFSVTFGAGGSTREGTLETVLEIRRAGHEAAPHISCVASSKAEIAAILEKYKASGIRHIVALRGDLPSGVAMAGELRYASELVAYVRERTGDWFEIEVGCYPEYHPQTRNAADEIVKTRLANRRGLMTGSVARISHQKNATARTARPTADPIAAASHQPVSMLPKLMETR